MTTQELIAKRIELGKKVDAYKEKIDKEWHPIINQYISEHSPVEHNKVYEIVGKEGRKRGFSRFVIYSHRVTFFDNDWAFIIVGGWWLNSESIPTKWESYTVYGVSNPIVFNLSDNQEHKPHPEAEKEVA